MFLDRKKEIIKLFNRQIEIGKNDLVHYIHNKDLTNSFVYIFINLCLNNNKFSHISIKQNNMCINRIFFLKIYMVKNLFWCMLNFVKNKILSFFDFCEMSDYASSNCSVKFFIKFLKWTQNSVCNKNFQKKTKHLFEYERERKLKKKLKIFLNELNLSFKYFHINKYLFYCKKNIRYEINIAAFPSFAEFKNVYIS
nr:hypothetical protein 1634Bnrm1_p055 [Cryptomonas sp.]